MTSESLIPDPYEVVLADLRAKRDQIDQTIQTLEALRANRTFAPPSSPLTIAPQVPVVEGPGAFLGMSIPEATIKLLGMRRQAMGNVEIWAALKAGGLALNSADPINTIGAVITRRSQRNGDIVKVGRGIWGLKEWYPNRSFKPKNGDEAKPSTSEPESPSEPTLDVDPK